MSTSEQDNLESADSEELVAYLDGELPPEESRRIEERLASNADYRDQLRELDQAWEALDSLPRANARDDFARTTIEMVAVEAADDLKKKHAETSKSHNFRRLRWAAVALVAAAAGFAVAGALLPNEDKHLLENLPAIRQVDLLADVSDIDFLRELSKHVTVEQMTRDQKDLKEDIEAIHKASADTKDERENWVRQLSAEEKLDLHAQQSRFLDFTPKEQQRLVDFAREIDAADDSEKLRETLVAYSQWLSNKRQNLKFELNNRQAPANTRVARIGELVKADGRRLSEDEKRKLRNEIHAITLEHKEAMFAAAALRTGEIDEVRKRVEPLPTTLELCTVFWALNNSDTRDKTRKQLVDQLDEETRESLAESDVQRGGGIGQRGSEGGPRGGGEAPRGDGGRGGNEAPRGGGDGQGPRGGGAPRDLLSRWIVNDVLPLRRNHSPQELMRFFREELNDETKKNITQQPDFEEVLAMRYDAGKIVSERDFEVLTGVRMPPFMGGRGGRGGDGPPRGGGRGRRGGPESGPQFGFEGGSFPFPERGDRGGGGRGREGRGGEPFEEPPPRGEGRGPLRGGPGEPPSGPVDPSK